MHARYATMYNHTTDPIDMGRMKEAVVQISVIDSDTDDDVARYLINALEIKEGRGIRLYKWSLHPTQEG